MNFQDLNEMLENIKYIYQITRINEFARKGCYVTVKDFYSEHEVINYIKYKQEKYYADCLKNYEQDITISKLEEGIYFQMDFDFKLYKLKILENTDNYIEKQ